MARVTGPLFSLDASGTLGQAITAFSLRGRACMRKRANNRQGWSLAQRVHNARISYLRATWRTLPLHTPAGLQATWQTVADEFDLPLFQSFVKYNLARWTQTAGPIITPGGGGSGGSGGTLAFRTVGKGFIGFNCNQFSSQNNFGQLIFCKAGSDPFDDPKQLALVAPYWKIANLNDRLMITHLEPGSYNVRSYELRTNGTHSVAGAFGPVTVT